MDNINEFICGECGAESTIGGHGLSNGEIVSRYYCDVHYNELKRGVGVEKGDLDEEEV